MHAVLKIETGPNAGQEVPVVGEELVIGRHSSCEVMLPLETVSRRHARIFLSDAAYYIEDLKSLNGTFVNNQEIEAATRLVDGDALRINKVHFTFFDALDARESTTHETDIKATQNDPFIIARMDVWDSPKRASVSSEAKLRAMLAITHCLDYTLDMKTQVLPRILETVSSVFPRADCLSILMGDDPNGRLQLAAVHHGARDSVGGSDAISRTIVRLVMQEGQAMLSADAAHDDRFENSQSIHDVDIRSVMCAPLTGVSSKPMGAIHVVSRGDAQQFEQADLDILTSVAVLVGQILECSRLNTQYLQAERLSAIGQMMAGLAHESRNALQRSQASLERLEMRVADQPESLALIHRVQAAQDELAELYNQVQSYAAPLSLHRRRTNLADILRNAWENLEPKRKDRPTRLIVNEPPGIDLDCEVDVLQIERVFSNLLENAMSAGEDPVEIKVSWSDDRTDSQSAVRVTVLDNGPGLDENQRAQAFTPFFTSKINGTGLGLPLTRRYVESHHGWIDVVDHDGPGAEFVFVIPRRTPK